MKEPRSATTSFNNIGVSAFEQGKNEEAVQILQQPLAIREKLLPPDDLLIAESRMNLSLPMSNLPGEADKAHARNILASAIEIYKRRAPNSPDLAQALSNLGAMHAEVSQFSEALPLLTEALQIQEHVLRPGHTDIANTHADIANIELTMKQFEPARRHYEKALESYVKAGIPNHQYFAYVKNNLASLHIAIGQFEKGRRLNREALAVLDKSQTENLALSAELEEGFAGYLEEAGLHPEAKAALARAADLKRRQPGNGS